MSSWFGFFDTDNFIYNVARTRYSKEQCTYVLEMLLAQFIRSYIKFTLDNYICFNPILDFMFGIGLSVGLILCTPTIYHFVQGMWHKQLYAFTRHLINNYTEENFKQWKQRSILAICSILFFHLFFVKITSSILQIQLIQFVISYFIVDWIDDYRSSSSTSNTSIKKIISSLISKIYNSIVFFIAKIYSFLKFLFHPQNLYYILHINDENSEHISDLSEEEYICEKEDEILDKRTKYVQKRRRWSTFDDIHVVEDSPFSSLVVFQDE